MWKNLRFPEGKFAEDLRIIYKIYDITTKYKIIDYNFYNYYMSPNSSTRGEFNIKKLEDLEAWEEMFQFFKNKYSDIDISNLKAVFCRRLLRYYFLTCEYKNIQIDLKKKFNSNVKNVLKSKKLNYKEKSVYLLFRISPILCKKKFGKTLNI